MNAVNFIKHDDKIYVDASAMLGTITITAAVGKAMGIETGALAEVGLALSDLIKRIMDGDMIAETV